MKDMKNEIQKTIVYIAGILSNVSSVEGMAFTLYKGVKNVECVILCIQDGEILNEKLLESNFGVRTKMCELMTGMKIKFRVIPSNILSDKVEGYNAMDLKELMNSEILIDRKGRLVKLQSDLCNSNKSTLGSYFNQIDLDAAVRSLSM